MKIVNNKIVECTKEELYRHWLNAGWDILYPFDEYKTKMINLGVKIIEDK